MVKFTALIYFSRVAYNSFDSFFSNLRYIKSFLNLLDIFSDDLAITSKDLIFCAKMLLTQTLDISTAWI